MKKHAPEIDPEVLIEYHRTACEKMRAQLATKNCRYSTGKDGYTDGFRNITRTENAGGAQAEFGLIERVNDKLGRIESFLYGSGTPALKVVSDCLEAANYWLIMAALIETRAIEDGLIVPNPKMDADKVAEFKQNGMAEFKASLKISEVE